MNASDDEELMEVVASIPNKFQLFTNHDFNESGHTSFDAQLDSGIRFHWFVLSLLLDL
jgi:hypothetical protein